jgi:hypothetical protein
MKLVTALISVLLLSGCAGPSGLVAIPDGGFLPPNVPTLALGEVIDYAQLNNFGEIKSIFPVTNQSALIRLRVLTSEKDSLFTLISKSNNWQISEVS